MCILDKNHAKNTLVSVAFLKKTGTLFFKNEKEECHNSPRLTSNYKETTHKSQNVVRTYLSHDCHD